MHKGIPHLQCTVSKMEICSAVGLGLESAIALISNVETASVTTLTPCKEDGKSSFLNLQTKQNPEIDKNLLHNETGVFQH